MNVAGKSLVDDYLSALRHAARALPRRERDELLGEIRQHIETALPPDATEADVRNVLDRLGSPHDIVAAAGPAPTGARRGAREVFALILLVTGLPPLFGWLAGLGLLLWSPLWTARQKLMAVLVWPGGLYGMVFVFMITAPVQPVESCRQMPTAPTPTTACSSIDTGPPGWITLVLVLVLFAAPLLMATHLWRAAGRRSAPS